MAESPIRQWYIPFYTLMQSIIRDNDVIRKFAAYVILGINADGRNEVLSIQVGNNENSKYWLSVLIELINRGVKEILIIYAVVFIGLKEAIVATFPKKEYQRCIVYQIRNTQKYVPHKNRKAFATDLKTIRLLMKRRLWRP